VRSPGEAQSDRLNPEKVAYWYLRLNGFLQIEDFYVHPGRHGAARTDADLIGVRFPHRAERLYDDPGDIMEDDVERLALSDARIDVVIAEVKAGRCALNGPWTDPERQNVHRVLAAIGCLPHSLIGAAAASIYGTGLFQHEGSLCVRLIAIGRDEDPDMRLQYPHVPQITWGEVLGFIFDRLKKYQRQKTQTDHWDSTGRRLKEAVNQYHNVRQRFLVWAMAAMNIRGRPE
jgi:hypothetical protein